MTEFKIRITHGRDGVYLHVWELKLRTALNGKDLLEANTKQVEAKISQIALALTIHSLHDNSHCAVLLCDLARKMCNRLKGHYTGGTVMNEQPLMNSSVSLKYN